MAKILFLFITIPGQIDIKNIKIPLKIFDIDTPWLFRTIIFASKLNKKTFSNDFYKSINEDIQYCMLIK